MTKLIHKKILTGKFWIKSPSLWEGLGWAIVFCSFISISFPQGKYYIYFKDKGIQKTETLNKFSNEYLKAIENLSERSIQRRMKTLGEDNIINYDDLPIQQNYIDALTSHGIKIENRLTWFNAVTSYLNDIQKSFIGTLSFVDKIEPVRVFNLKREEIISANQLGKITSNQDQIKYGSSFTQLNISDIPQVHAKGINGEGIIIGILDTGFKWKEHESLINANVIGEYDFIFKDSITANQSGDRSDQHHHGIAVYSALVVNITAGSLGYNEFDDSVYSYKYSDMNGNTTIVTKAAELAFQRGIVTLSAVGNEGDDPWFYLIAPADGFNTIAVGAVTSNNVLANFSSRGPSSDGRIKPEIVAQGVGVFSASSSRFNSYTTLNGTSLATPIAAGVASLLLSAHPHLKNTQVRNILMETADNSSSPDNERGYGLISAANAISFPNFQVENNTFKLNKIFLNYNGLDLGSIKLNYSTNGNDYQSKDMTFDGTLKFITDISLLPDGQMVDFYFTFKDRLGNELREPGNNTTYKFKYGDLNIYHNLSVPVPYDFGILSQNYPNPFNNITTIEFKASSVEHAEIVIIDAIGQKIKTLFNGLTKKDRNIIQWDGLTDSGVTAASGVYLYILKIAGQEFGKKM